MYRQLRESNGPPRASKALFAEPKAGARAIHREGMRNATSFDLEAQISHSDTLQGHESL